MRLFGGAGALCAGAVGVVALVQGAPLDTILLLGVVLVAGASAALAATRGRPKLATRIFTWTFFGAAVVGTLRFGGVETSAPITLVSAVALFGALRGRTALYLSAVVGSLATVAIAWAAHAGWLPPTHAPNTPAMGAATVVANIVMIVLVFRMGQHAFDWMSHRVQDAEDTDPVSGARSLAWLRREIDSALASTDPSDRCALMVIRLERGALVRRGLGPGARDTMLKAAAERLSGIVSPRCRVGRVGEDEFAVLARGVASLGDAAERARFLAAHVQTPVVIGERNIGLRVRMGVVMLAPHHEGSDDVLRDGLAALAAVKGSGGMLVGTYDKAAVDAARRDLELDEDIADALAADEMVPFYQPIVSLEDGQLCGFEALVRWQRGERIIFPGAFVPRAEATGALVEIDRAILRAACRQLVEWDASFPEARPWVSVNLCAAQFSTNDLVQVVRSVLEETGLSPERLHLELTESGLAADVQRTRQLLSELKEMGVVLALDDFGTGWSSLQYIQQYPLDVVKIDRSFISPIDELGGDELASTVIFMAKRLGLGVVAEGIETRTQYRVLREHGVAEGQGYHFSRPLDAARASMYLMPFADDEPSCAWDRRILRFEANG